MVRTRMRPYMVVMCAPYTALARTPTARMRNIIWQVLASARWRGARVVWSAHKKTRHHAGSMVYVTMLRGYLRTVRHWRLWPVSRACRAA